MAADTPVGRNVIILDPDWIEEADPAATDPGLRRLGRGTGPPIGIDRKAIFHGMLRNGPPTISRVKSCPSVRSDEGVSRSRKKRPTLRRRPQVRGTVRPSKLTGSRIVPPEARPWRERC